MTSKERVYRTIRGLSVDRTPVYGWLFMNLKDQIAQAFGSVEKFEDNYGFDMAHLFGSPSPFFYEKYEEIRRQEGEVTPEDALDIPLTDLDDMALYEDIKKALAHHKARYRFCYVQTPGFFENFNSVFGIEDHLCYTILYREELRELYRRQVEWTKKFAANCIELGVDIPIWHVLMASISDPTQVNVSKGLIIAPLERVDLTAYSMILSYKTLWSGYRNTIFYIILSCALTGVLTVIAGFVFSRSRFYYRNTFMLINVC